VLIHAATDNDIHPPTFGGSQRTFGLLRGLARAHEVRALCVVPNRGAGAAEERVDGVSIVRRKAWYTSAVWRLERAHLAPMFLAAAMHARRERVWREALPGRADALLADLNLAALMGGSDARLLVHTSHNVEFDLFRSAGARVIARGAWAAQRRAQERRAVEAADVTVVCTAEDEQRMRELYRVDEAALAVVPNGYDETRIRPPSAAEREQARASLGFAPGDYVALFLGSDVPHNRAALCELLERVLPPLAGDGIKLLVAGSVSRALAGRREPWLLARPEAADVSGVLHASDAGLNPVTSGGGSNVKLPAYLAAGLAVVTTPFGLRGYSSLRPHVTSASIEEMPESLRARPLGWLARGEAMPVEVAAHAWGRLGEQLGRTLEQRLRAREAQRAAPEAPEPRRGAAGGGR
jgi:glycosyltransferase involved in cell wall biosynthesis